MKEVGQKLKLDDFRLLRQLGVGATGEVHLAEHAVTGQRVALKILGSELADEPTAVERFFREAKAAAAIDSPHTATIVGIGDRSGPPFFAMQYIHGESLAQRLSRDRRLPLAEATSIARQCLVGLGATHEQGLVHRDVKPANILLAGDRAVLVDFGMVFIEDDGTRLTTTGRVIGSLAYMSPEQCSGHAVNGAADLYALGVVLFEMLTGHLPYPSDDPMALLHEKLHKPPDLSALRTRGDSMTSVVESLLRQQPSHRFQTAEDAISALDTASDRATRDTVSLPVAPATDTAPTRQVDARRQKRRNSHAAAWAAALIATAIVASGLLFFSAMRQTDRPRAESPVNRENAEVRESGAANQDAASQDEADVAVSNAVAPDERPPVERGQMDSQETTVEPMPRMDREIENSIGMRLIRVSSGSFSMGTDPTAEWLKEADLQDIGDEMPGHEVTISRDFYMGAYEVCRGEFETVMGKVAPIGAKEDPSKPADGNLPMTRVTWHDCAEFCRLLSARKEERARGRVYRLPTEAEWEYACRAGTNGPYYWGDGAADFGEFAWAKRNSGGELQPVGKLRPNDWGFYDMLGNAYEWCADQYKYGYYKVSPPVDPSGPTTGKLGRRYVIRGGSFNYSFKRRLHRSNSRSHHAEGGWRSYIGFRVVAIVDDMR